MDTKGSRMDLLNWLREEMKSSQAYDKVFQSIWGASGVLMSVEMLNYYNNVFTYRNNFDKMFFYILIGGWSVIMCPH